MAEFDWLGIIFIPLIMTIFVGGVVALFLSRWLAFEQLVTNAMMATLEMSTGTVTGDYNDAKRTLRGIAARIRGSAVALLIQGHVEAADQVNELAMMAEKGFGLILTNSRDKFRGEQSNDADFDLIEEQCSKVAQKLSVAFANVETPWWRYFRLRSWKPKE